MPVHNIGGFRRKTEPYYQPVAQEVDIFNAAARNKLPVLLKGPTGCGKTRFLEYMSFKLNRPLVTIACHEDLTTSDLVGRYLLKGSQTEWVDGPLTIAVKNGGICYLDEVVEARKDTIVVIHPLTDDRRVLPLEKKGEIVEADDNFLLVVSYNPGYQTILKDLKQSTKQRFVSLEFGFPPKEIELKILSREAGIPEELASTLVELAEKIRSLKNRGLEEGVSTRLLIYAAKLLKDNVPLQEAVSAALINSLTDDQSIQRSLRELTATIFNR